MNIEQLIADLRARINPQYYDQVGTESYERHQVVKALEYLATENERLKELMAKRTREHQQEMTSFRLRVRSQDDATFAALRDEVNGLTGSLDRAEKALKEAQEQEPVAYMIHEYQGTGEKRLQFQPHIPSIRDDVTGPIVTALYARPVPAAPAVAAPEMTDDALKEMLNAAQIVGYDDPLRIVRGFAMRVLQEWGDQEGMHKAFLDAVKPAVAAPAEWREVLTELADDLSIELDMRYQSRSHYPSELRKYENEMQPVYRASALLQSTGDKK